MHIFGCLSEHRREIHAVEVIATMFVLVFGNLEKGFYLACGLSLFRKVNQVIDDGGNIQVTADIKRPETVGATIIDKLLNVSAWGEREHLSIPFTFVVLQIAQGVIHGLRNRRD